MREVIALESVPIKIHYLVSIEENMGQYEKVYAEETILGVFQPIGTITKRGKMYNQEEGKWQLFAFSNYVIQNEYIIEYNNKYYKVKQVDDWSQYGYMRYICELMTIAEAKDLLNFLEGVPNV